jgi:hypothetical protein
VGWSGRRRRQRGEEDGDEEPRDGHGRGRAGWGFLRAPRKGIYGGGGERRERLPILGSGVTELELGCCSGWCAVNKGGHEAGEEGGHVGGCDWAMIDAVVVVLPLTVCLKLCSSIRSS